eukprot:11157827-Lingulodinium_polyedra.AAC.1
MRLSRKHFPSATALDAARSTTRAGRPKGAASRGSHSCDSVRLTNMAWRRKTNGHDAPAPC